MNALNEKALASLNNLDAADEAYCLKLSQHLENMGMSSTVISSAVSSLADGGKVPSFIPAAATPSQFAALLYVDGATEQTASANFAESPALA